MISHIIYAFTSPSAFRVKTNSMAAADVDMPLAESSLATSRRQHLGQTFEAYRAELDDDVKYFFDSGKLWANGWTARVECIARKTHHPLAINHPAIQETHLPPPPRGQCPARPAPQKPRRGREKGERNCRSVQEYQARIE